MSEEQIKPCPFCGMEIDITDEDTMYPDGTYWYDNPDLGRVYVNRDQLVLVPFQFGRCWGIHCQPIYGGCGASMTGDSEEEVIAKWQRRV